MLEEVAFDNERDRKKLVGIYFETFRTSLRIRNKLT